MVVHINEEIDTNTPTLRTLRNHEVGKFYNLNEAKETRTIKTLTLPPWMKYGRPKKFSIDSNILEILKNDGTKSKRHTVKKPKWVPGRGGNKGYYLCHVRIPSGNATGSKTKMGNR